MSCTTAAAVFEGARCYSTPNGSACFRLDAHMRRLFDSAKIYRMDPEISQPALTEAVFETIRANEFKACYIRPIVYRGLRTARREPVPLSDRDCDSDLGMGRVPRRRRAGAGSGRASELVEPRRAEHLPDAGQKRGQLREFAADQDGSNRRGLQRRHRARHQRPVSEGSGQNLFLVRDNVLYTPPLAARGAAGHHPELDHPDRPRQRLHGDRGSPAPRAALHRRTRRSSSAPPPRSRQSGRSTRSPSDAAAAAR